MKIKATVRFPGAESKCATIELFTPCFCDRDITADELKDIVTKLRKKDDVHPEQQFAANGLDPLYQTKGDTIKLVKLGKEFYTLDKKKYTGTEIPKRYKKDISKFDKLGNNIFTSKRSEKIDSSQANDHTLFAKHLNETFTRYDINSCIRKIHFLAQCYHESGGFIDTYEGKNAVTNPSGGKDFVGRGIKQITHDYNYLACYSEEQRIINEDAGKTIKKSLFDIYIKKRNKDKFQSVTSYLKEHTTTHGFPENFIQTLKDFLKKISTDLKPACVSAGFFWKYREVYKFADNDDVSGLTNRINGGFNGLKEREKYTKDLKKIMRYENCRHKK
ncbi:hypothetical protein PG911_16685 [Tenacibaculum ovolyticum]|uniref:hypothetical protein n=1 Tax=Tenacibaculum ovolyticum TaxID=104270 RepID=UPI0022F3F178|nr:hypothetical protein [Tenacibaculum ovolyticum]WBX76241.1 hypothetical protein PG911_16685 [Tenacibaculum ovolyticum]